MVTPCCWEGSLVQQCQQISSFIKAAPARQKHSGFFLGRFQICCASKTGTRTPASNPNTTLTFQITKRCKVNNIPANDVNLLIASCGFLSSALLVNLCLRGFHRVTASLRFHLSAHSPETPAKQPFTLKQSQPQSASNTAKTHAGTLFICCNPVQ